MEVHFTSELEAKLTRLAAEQGRKTEALVQEAVERFINFDEWFMREVEKAWRPLTGASSLNTRKSASLSRAGIPANAHPLDAAGCLRPYTHLRLHQGA
jgi:predicted transcriptional regulator